MDGNEKEKDGNEIKCDGKYICWDGNDMQQFSCKTILNSKYRKEEEYNMHLLINRFIYI